MHGHANRKKIIKRIACLNNVKQLDLAHKLYVDDNEGFCYPRTLNPAWMTGLLGAYQDINLLHCPSGVTEIEYARHSSGGQRGGGGSNFAFMDGSARYLKFGAAISPINLWAVTDLWRTNAMTIGP